VAKTTRSAGKRSLIAQSVVLPAPPEDLYAAYLDPKQHGAIIGAPVKISAKAGSAFSAYGGTYTVSGDTLTVQAQVSKSPRPMARHEMIVFSYKIEADTLILVPIRDSNGPMTNPTTTTLKRIE